MHKRNSIHKDKGGTEIEAALSRDTISLETYAYGKCEMVVKMQPRYRTTHEQQMAKIFLYH